MTTRKLLASLGVVLVLTLGACSGGSTEPSPTAATTETQIVAETPSETPTEAVPTPDGSRSNPFMLNTPTRIGRWEVTLFDANYNETGYDQYSTIPSDYTVISVGVRATLVDPINENEAVSAVDSLYPGFVSTDGVLFDVYSSPCFFEAGGWDGSLPDFYGAGTSEGRFCTAVPSDKIEGGVWKVEGLVSGVTRFFSGQ